MITKIIKDFNLKTIANSGQIFRMNLTGDDSVRLLSKDRLVNIKKIEKSTYQFDIDESEFNDYYVNYFDLENDYSKYRKVCKSDDEFLKNCIQYATGLRILNQDPFEMLISFIISQRKSISAIKTSIEKLAYNCTKEIKKGKEIYHPFPSAKEIYDNKEKVYNCSLGYRTEYVIGAAKTVLENPDFLKNLHSKDNDYVENILMKIKGVGIKVSSCIMLFAYHRMDICPVDVWIKRVIENKYQGKIPDEYKKYQGMIQQYWFYYAKDKKNF